MNHLRKIDMKASGENIRKRCEQAGLNPKELSRTFDIDISTVYYWFQGKSLPRFDIAYGLAQLCGCYLDDLIVLEETENV